MMRSPSSSFDASQLIRKLSLRKKKWPDDYVIVNLPGSGGSASGVNGRRSSGNNAKGGETPYFASLPSSPSPTSSHPLTSLASTELRAQFADQLKCLDTKLDLDVTVMAELHEFYRRRALVEQEYSEALAKLVNSLKHKHSNETAKRPNWNSYSTTTLWNTLLGSTQRLSDAHGTLSEIFGKHMLQRLTDMDEDANRLHKQCREMMMRCQEKVFANIAKLQSDQREYGQRQSAQLDSDKICRRSEEKLLIVRNNVQLKKKEPEKSQKFRRAQADYNQKCHAFQNTVLSTNHARNEYLIQLCAANQSLHRYFTEEVSDILDCMSCGLHNSLARAAMMHLSCEESLKKLHGSAGEMINRNITALDWRADKASFLRCHDAAFARPPAFSFLPFKEDCESEVIAMPPLGNSLSATAADLRLNLEHLKASTEEAWNNLQDIEKKLLVLINQNDYDVSELFFADSLLAGKRRRRSISPLGGGAANGGTIDRQVPPSPGPHTATSLSSLNRTPLSSSPLPHDEVMGSKGSVGSGGTAATAFAGGGGAELQSGLYLTMRNAYREQRIKEERIYMERFSAYTQEMHRYMVMLAKLAEIERALAKQKSASSTITTPQGGKMTWRPSGLSLTSSTSLQGGHASQFGDTRCPLTPADAPPPPPPGTAAAATSPTTNNTPAIVKVAPRRVLQVPNVGRPKLFGGTIDEYVKKTGEQIPRVVLSCIRVINLYGMYHQGVFRVPGSQAEIASFKQAFEYGDDPLVGLSDARDINSTAGLLKLYFRELGEPPFPKEVFVELVKAVREKRDSDECVEHLASIVSSGLSHSVFIVMRYLFAFLNHLAEHSDENMMDPYNLAICFGPTLMPAPADLDQVEFQSNVNDVIKLFINHHRRIFDPTVPGAYYEKFAAYASAAVAVPPVLPRALASEAAKKATSLRHQASFSLARENSEAAATAREAGGSSQQTASRVNTSVSPEELAVGVAQGIDGKPASFTSSIDRLSIDDGLDDDDDDDNDDESDSDLDADDPQPLYATASAAFAGSSHRELSFQRGAGLLLYRRLNEHWWEGQPASEPEGPRYLVPHLYVRPVGGATPSAQTATAAVDAAASVTPGNAPLVTTDGGSTSGVDEDVAESESATGRADLASPPRKPLRRSSGGSQGEEAKGKISVSSTPLDSTGSPSHTIQSNRSSTTSEEISKPTGIQRLSSVNELANETNGLSGDLTEAYDASQKEAPVSPTSITSSASSSTSASCPLADQMSRSMSVSPPLLSSPQRRASSRCSWAGIPSTVISASTKFSATNTLYESDESSGRFSATEVEVKPSEMKTSAPSLEDIDTALAQVMRGLANLEGDSVDQEVNGASTAEQRLNELKEKMRLPFGGKLEVAEQRPKPPNWVESGLSKKPPQDDSADTFAEQAGGTVRKRVSARLDTVLEAPRALAASASLSSDLDQSKGGGGGAPVSEGKPVWWTTRKLSAAESEVTSLIGGGVMSKSFAHTDNGGSKRAEKENVTGESSTDAPSPIPIKRGSIAAKVAVFEATKSASATPPRPSWVRKT